VTLINGIEMMVTGIIEEMPVQTASELPSEVGNRPLDDVLTAVERREILAALEKANGQRTLAAKLLHISRSRLYRRLEALGIESSVPQSDEME